MIKTKELAIAFALISGTLFVSPALADELIFNGVNGANYGGYYVSPYSAQDVTLGHVIQLYCLDFNHDVSWGQQWTANIETLSSSNVGNYQYGANNTSFVLDPNDPNYGVFARYESAAWLFSQEGTAPDNRTLGVYEYAAWQLFLDTAHQSQYDSALASINAPDPITHNTFQHDVAQALAAAMTYANYSTANLSMWNVVTPVPAGQTNSVQEFLTPVPEPAAAVPVVKNS